MLKYIFFISAEKEEIAFSWAIWLNNFEFSLILKSGIFANTIFPSVLIFIFIFRVLCGFN